MTVESHTVYTARVPSGTVEGKEYDLMYIPATGYKYCPCDGFEGHRYCYHMTAFCRVIDGLLAIRASKRAASRRARNEELAIANAAVDLHEWEEREARGANIEAVVDRKLRKSGEIK